MKTYALCLIVSHWPPESVSPCSSWHKLTFLCWRAVKHQQKNALNQLFVAVVRSLEICPKVFIVWSPMVLTRGDEGPLDAQCPVKCREAADSPPIDIANGTPTSPQIPRTWDEGYFFSTSGLKCPYLPADGDASGTKRTRTTRKVLWTRNAVSISCTLKKYSLPKLWKARFFHVNSSSASWRGGRF